jgi:hypothetical protein
MKFLKKITVGLMVLAGSIHMGWSWGEAAQDPVGYIKFSKESGGGGKSCTIEIKTGVTQMKSTSCDNDEASYFQLNNVGSATEILLSSDEYCLSYMPGITPDWVFHMKTIVHPTTTIWLSIPDLRNKQDDEILVKGLRMIKNDYRNGNIQGKLSCVIINLSELDPPWPFP